MFACIVGRGPKLERKRGEKVERSEERNRVRKREEQHE